MTHTPMHRFLPLTMAVACLAFLCGAQAHAAEPGGTLKKIRDSGVITVAYRESSIPFSYLNDKTEPVGYAQELCGRVVDAVKKELKLPALEVRRQAVTSQNRIPLVQNGTVDIECGSTVNNLEREPLVSFSVTTFVVGTRFMGRKADNLKTLEDLKGKTVVITSGTNTVKRIRDLNTARNLGMTMIFGKDFSDSMLLLSSGRASAFFEDDILLTGQAASQQNPDEYALSTESYSADPYALMMRRDDPDFKRLVDDTLVGIYRSGEINRIYDRWFMKPIPPRNVTLNFPMGAALKRVIAQPTDSYKPEDYR